MHKSKSLILPYNFILILYLDRLFCIFKKMKQSVFCDTVWGLPCFGLKLVPKAFSNLGPISQRDLSPDLGLNLRLWS